MPFPPSVMAAAPPSTAHAPDTAHAPSPAHAPVTAHAPITAHASDHVRAPTAALPSATTSAPAPSALSTLSSAPLVAPALPDVSPSLSDLKLPSWTSLNKLIDLRRPRLPPTRREAKGLVDALVWAPQEVREGSIVEISKQWDMRLVWSSVAAERAIEAIEHHDPRPPSASVVAARPCRPARGRVNSAPATASSNPPDPSFSEFAPRSPVAEEAAAALAYPRGQTSPVQSGRPAPLPPRSPRTKKPCASASKPTASRPESSVPVGEPEPELNSDEDESDGSTAELAAPARVTLESLLKPISDERGMRGFRSGRIEF